MSGYWPEIGMAHDRMLAEIRRADAAEAARHAKLEDAAEASASRAQTMRSAILEEQERIQAQAISTEVEEALAAEAARAKWLGELEDRQALLLTTGQGRWRSVEEILAGAAGWR